MPGGGGRAGIYGADEVKRDEDGAEQLVVEGEDRVDADCWEEVVSEPCEPASLMTRVVPPRRRGDATTSTTGHIGPGATGA